jgi:hypothetical protein
MMLHAAVHDETPSHVRKSLRANGRPAVQIRQKLSGMALWYQALVEGLPSAHI